MHPLAVAYLDVVYAIAQLFGGVIVGLLLKRLIGVKKSLLLGLGLSAIFNILLSFTTNATLIFILTSLNGLGYGLTYNILLGMAMQPFAKDMREVTMGIYQTFFAIGIFYGDKIFALLIKMLPSTLQAVQLSQTVFALMGGLSVVTMLVILIVFRSKHERFLEA